MSNTSPTGNAPAWLADCLAGWLHPAAASHASATNARANDFRLGIGLSRWSGLGACPAAQVVTAPAASLVDLGAAHDDAAAPLHFSIRTVGGRTADDADRERLGDVFGDRQQLRHGLERPCEVILVQAGHDHPLAHAGQLLHHVHEALAQELALVDADDLRLVR